jgi:hypothetical protein
MSNIGVKFDFDKLDRPANIEEYKDGEKSPPCVNHDKQTIIEEQKERLNNVKSKLGQKFDEGKLRYDLYPLKAYEGCTRVLTFGANKYTPNGWRSVPDANNRYYAALIRHLNAQKEYLDNGGIGLALDEESGLPHLDHAQCCLIFLREKINEVK